MAGANADKVATPSLALKYGALEALLMDLTGAGITEIASRFRKLRPKFAADNLLSKPGFRVEYDLPRILSICAVFLVNGMAVPQGHAVAIVVSNWPEIARASLAAWAETGVSNLSPTSRAGPVVRIYVDALRSAIAGRDGSPATWASVDPQIIVRTSHLVLDCGEMVRALTTLTGESAGFSASLATAFAELDRAYGWGRRGENDPPLIPSRVDSSFFGTGPYFERARALLAVHPAGGLGEAERIRLQAYLDYVEDPAPIDGWKPFIGTAADEPRLVHMLATWGHELGLQPSMIASETLRATTFPSDLRALELIARGQRRQNELAKGGC